MTTLSEAFQVMTWSLFWVEGRRTQVRGVCAWERLVAHAVDCADKCGRTAEMPGDPILVRVHQDWQESCAMIIAALRDHANEAYVLYCEMTEEARAAGVERDQQADAAARHAADRDQHHAWAAQADDDRLQGMCEAAAAAAETARAEAERQAASASERHEAALEDADEAMEWRVAALQAAGAGDLLVMSEDTAAEPLTRAYANAGGQIAGVKEHHTMGGHAA
jgi:hypothetical protein